MTAEIWNTYIVWL